MTCSTCTGPCSCGGPRDQPGCTPGGPSPAVPATYPNTQPLSSLSCSILGGLQGVVDGAREPALQAHVLELLGTLPRSYAEIREALRGRGERPNAQKLGNCLERLTREGKVTHEPINCVEVYRLAGASSRPSKRAPGAMRMSERLGTVEGPSGRRLMMRDEEWADG